MNGVFFMKKFIYFLVSLLLAVAIIASMAWYLFVYDRDFTRDFLLSQARYNDLYGNSRLSSMFYNLAYDHSGRDENVAIELANQYKSDGKLDTGNLTNILNLTTLATNVKGLKGMTDKTTFYKDFASGLIAGSGNLVTQNNSTAVMSGLTSLVNNVDLSALTDKAAGAQQQAAALQGKDTGAAQSLSSIKESVSGILGLLK